jgi:SHS2 domain-containing protein
MDRKGFEILEHPADLGIAAWGETMSEAFRQGALGLVSVILDPSRIDKIETIRVRVTAQDPEELLVRWLEEILYLYDGRGFVPGEIEMTKLTSNELEAKLQGQPVMLAKHEMRMDVKAVTYHQLAILKDDQGVKIQVFLDI